MIRLEQQARGHQAVPAIVALAAEHHHRARGGVEHLQRLIGHRLARPLHQRQAGDA